MTIWYASPTGLSSNSGTSAAAAWDLATAAAGGPTGTSVQPGDTIRLTRGTFGTGTETYTFTLNGSAALPIKVTANPGDQVAINCKQIDLRGSHTWLYNDTLCNLEVYRSTTTPADLTDLIRMQDGGDGNKVVNVAVHDAGGVGISPQSETADHEVNGCYVYNNGRAITDAPNYGHGIYAHGTTTAGTTRKIRGNILWDQVGYGIHGFANTGTLHNFEIVHNIALNNGLGTGTDILVGGETSLVGALVDHNVGCQLYGYLGDVSGVIGYLQYPPTGQPNGACTATNNYFRGGVRLSNWDAAGFTWKSNTVVGAPNQNQAVIWQFAGATANMTGNVADHNTYATLATSGNGLMAIVTFVAGAEQGIGYHTFADYQAAIGQEGSSTYTAAGDLGTQVFVFPSDYVAGRGHVFIDNPTSAATVAVDLSPIIPSGQNFAVYSVYDLPCATNPGATAVLTGTYTSGTVAVPMTTTGKAPQPIIGNPFTPSNALPLAGAFLVVQTSPVTTPSLILSAATASFIGISGANDPAPQSIAITSTVAAHALAASASYTTASGWLSLSFDSSTTPAALRVTPTLGNLAAGTYAATVLVTSSDAANSPQSIAVSLAVTAAVAPPPPPPPPPPSQTGTGTPLPTGPATPTLFDRTPVTTRAGEGWLADLDYRLQQLFAALNTIAQGSPGVAVDHLTVQPPALTLTIDTAPTTVSVDHITVTPTSLTLTPPTQVVIGTEITHAAFGHTLFGNQPGPTDLAWAVGSPLFRTRWLMGGNLAAVAALSPDTYRLPYGLHHFCIATGQEATEGSLTSWGTMATTWAQANGQNVEDVFLHAAVGQQTNVAHVASISATGLITLGFNPSNNKQQLAQSRAGVAASNAFQIGATYTLTFLNQPFAVTVASIPSQITIQTNYTGAAISGAGLIFTLGDGSKTFANRIFFESETDWAWATNPGSAAGKNFQVFRVGQIVNAGNTGIFWDSHSSSNLHFASVEYGTTSSAQYATDLSTLFSLYRTTYHGTLYFPNLANFVTATDDAFASAAGGCQMEGALNILQSNRPHDTLGANVVSRLAAGVVIEITGVPSFNGATPHAGVTGLSAAQRAGGGHNFSTVDDRYAMAVYAAYLILVNQRSPSEIQAGSLKRLLLDPASQFFDTFPLSARWETAYEFPLGEPTAEFPPRTVWQTGPDASGTTATVLVRVFTDTGSETGTPTAIVLMRVQGANTTTYDGTTAFAVPIPVDPPAGKTWGILTDTGTITGSFDLNSTVPLWNLDSAILVPH